MDSIDLYHHTRDVDWAVNNYSVVPKYYLDVGYIGPYHQYFGNGY